MPKTNKTKKSAKSAAAGQQTGAGGETHQIAGGTHPQLTNQRGLVVGDDENSLKAGERGPVLIEDHLLVEKLQHFDHERIPERIVHARGTGAYGYFKVHDDRASNYTYAPVLTDPSRKTPVFVRFSTVQGSRGSAVRLIIAQHVPC